MAKKKINIIPRPKDVPDHFCRKVIESTETETIETETIEPKKYKVEFTSTLYSQLWHYIIGEIVELEEDRYLIAKKYNSIKDL